MPASAKTVDPRYAEKCWVPLSVVPVKTLGFIELSSTACALPDSFFGLASSSQVPS